MKYPPRNLKELSLSDYSEVLLNFVSAIKVFPYVKTVYMINGIDVPGLSDIDLLVIVKNHQNIKPLLTKIYSLVKHETILSPTLLPEEVAKNVFRVIPIPFDVLRKLHGEEVHFELPSTIDEVYILLSHLIDYSFLYYLPIFYSIKHIFTSARKPIKYSHLIDVAEVTKRLVGIKYPALYMRQLKLKGVDNSLIEEIKTFREKLFQEEGRKKYVKLVNYTNLVFDAYLDLVDELTRFLYRNQIVNEPDYEVTKDKMVGVYFNPRHPVLFVENWRKIEARNYMNYLSKKWGYPLLVLPSNFRANLIEYSRHHGILCEYLRRDFLNKTKCKIVDEKYTESLRRKILLLNKWTKFLAMNNIHVGFRPFGYKYCSNLRTNIFENYFRLKRYLIKYIAKKERANACTSPLG